MKLFELYKQVMDEDYPIGWDIEAFKMLSSFNARIKYCESNLTRISSGSSRIVYKVDETKVLKLAKNKKGLAQNGIEIEYGRYRDLDDILAKVFDSDENSLWVEMEYAHPVKPNIFKNIVGVSFDDFSKVMHNHYHKNNPSKYGYQKPVNPEIETQMWEEEFTYGMLSLMANYDVPVGDLLRLNSYGLVNRGGQDSIVLIDFGINNDVWSSYYS